MRRNGKLIVIGVLAAGSVAVTSVGISVAASSASKPHTLSFNSKLMSQKQFGAHYVADEKDVAKGQPIGYDVLSGKINFKRESVSGDIAFALKGGIIYATYHQQVKSKSAMAPVTGKVTGGTGKYEGVTGTLSVNRVRKGVTHDTLTYK